jgi:hypothetical protein
MTAPRSLSILPAMRAASAALIRSQLRLLDGSGKTERFQIVDDDLAQTLSKRIRRSLVTIFLANGPFDKLLNNGLNDAALAGMQAVEALVDPDLMDALRHTTGDMESPLPTRPTAWEWRDPQGRLLGDRLVRLLPRMMQGVDRVLEQAVEGQYTYDRTVADVRAYLSASGRPQRLEPRLGLSATFQLIDYEVRRVSFQAADILATILPMAVGFQWIEHITVDHAPECELAAKGGIIGIGLYRPGTAPTYPAHPNCRCSLIPDRLPGFDSTERDLRTVLSVGSGLGVWRIPAPDTIARHVVGGR